MTATDEAQTVQAERTYSTDDMCHLAGVTPRQLSHWHETGYLPDHRPDYQRNSGYPRTYTQNDLDAVRIVVHLLRVGFVLDRAFGIARALVADDEYRTEFADVFQLEITVKPTPIEETP